jgi:hypothetical protein
MQRGVAGSEREMLKLRSGRTERFLSDRMHLLCNSYSGCLQSLEKLKISKKNTPKFGHPRAVNDLAETTQSGESRRSEGSWP